MLTGARSREVEETREGWRRRLDLVSALGRASLAMAVAAVAVEAKAVVTVAAEAAMGCVAVMEEAATGAAVLALPQREQQL